MLIVPKITDFTPSRKINIFQLNISQNTNLHNSLYNNNKKIAVLLSAELFFEFLRTDKTKLAKNLFLLSSCFWYLFSGSIYDSTNVNNYLKYCFLSKNLETLNKLLTYFWQIKDVENFKACKSDELNYCNEQFNKANFRKANGRYMVEMPFKSELFETVLENSKKIVSKRLDYLWQRLEHDPTIKNPFTDFLNEYLLSNHMQ